jgi:hypothetical protein
LSILQFIQIGFHRSQGWVSGEMARLFHPRLDRWDDHFSARSDGAIIAHTAVGRVTVDTLRMNSPRQLAARGLWMALKIFP